jgi:predicted transcriptional regulator
VSCQVFLTKRENATQHIQVGIFEEKKKDARSSSGKLGMESRKEIHLLLLLLAHSRKRLYRLWRTPNKMRASTLMNEATRKGRRYWSGFNTQD